MFLVWWRLLQIFLLKTFFLSNFLYIHNCSYVDCFNPNWHYRLHKVRVSELFYYISLSCCIYLIMYCIVLQQVQNPRIFVLHAEGFTGTKVTYLATRKANAELSRSSSAIFAIRDLSRKSTWKST